MHIIRQTQDIQSLYSSGAISNPLAQHLERKLSKLQQAVEPETALLNFSLEQNGYIGIYLAP